MSRRPGILAAGRLFARDIKLAHSVFALPFALASAWLVHRARPVPWTDWLAVLVAMVGARSSAMGFNRIADRRIDARNPRTRGRAVASGALPLGQAWAWTLASTAVFLAAAAFLGPLPLALSPVVIAVLWGYSLTKRFTALCHLVLGLALGLAPPAVEVALAGRPGAPGLLLGGAVLCWVAGFDVLYALQDRDFDARAGLRSIPVALGERGALRVSRLLHLLAAGLLAALPLAAPLGWPYLLAWLAVAGALVWEHSLVRPGDLSRLDQAFFAANGYVALALLAGVVAGSLAA